MNEGYYPRTQLWGKSVIETSKTFGHDPYGIFIAYGKHIKNEELTFDVSIMDLAPTILHLFKLPIPNYMDGRALVSIFNPQSEVAQRVVTYVDFSYYEMIRLKNKIKSLKLSGKLI